LQEVLLVVQEGQILVVHMGQFPHKLQALLVKVLLVEMVVHKHLVWVEAEAEAQVEQAQVEHILPLQQVALEYPLTHLGV
jgi:hypothetical protein